MKTLFLAVLGATALRAQKPPTKLEFEVASVRPSASSAQDRVDIGLHLDGSQARISSFRLTDYIAMAYRVKQYQISGPDWVGTDRFDLTAKLPAGATSDQIPDMLQALLADRFQIKFHHEKKDQAVYALVLGKTPLKLKEVAAGADDDAAPGTNVTASGSGAGVSVDMGHGSSYTFANNKFEVKKVTTDQMATILERYLDRPVVNLTELKGKYDVTLEVTPDDYQTLLIRVATNSGMVLPPEVLRLIDGKTPSSLMDAIQQAGLKLDARKAPLDFLVVDSARKTPTDN